MNDLTPQENEHDPEAAERALLLSDSRITDNLERFSTRQLNFISYDYRKYQIKSAAEVYSGLDLDPILIHACSALGANSSNVFMKTNRYVKAEVYGKIYDISHKMLTKYEIEAFVERIYGSNQGLSILTEGKPIDVSYVIKRENLELRFRVNISSLTVDGERGVAISLRKVDLKPYPLNYDEIDTEMIQPFYYPYGGIWIVGATGTGKTVLLSGFINHLILDRFSSKKIITLESPIEIPYDRVPQYQTFVDQVEVPRDVRDFQQGLKNAMRQKPNDILVGEIRDAETIETALQGITSGHLIYGTLHANNVAATFKRVAGWYQGAEQYAVVSEMVKFTRMIVSQRLFPNKEGKLSAVREYLVFDDNIVEAILNEDINLISDVVDKVVWEHGIPFAVHARQRVLEGLLDDSYVRLMLGGKKVSNDELDEFIYKQKQRGNRMFQNNPL